MSGRRTRHWSRCPGPLSAGRTSVHWSGGRPVSTRPVSTRPVSTRPARSWCPDRHACGDRGRGGVGAVRTALDPGMRRCGGAAHLWAHRGARCRWDRRVAGSSLPELGPGGEGMVVGSAVRGSPKGRRQTGPSIGSAEATAWRSPPGRPWELVQRRMPVGWLGARAGAAAPTSPRRCVLDRSPV
jgi:hypothetical protein